MMNILRCNIKMKSSFSAVTKGLLERNISEMPMTSQIPYFGEYFNYKFGKRKCMDYKISLLEKYRKHGKIFRENICGKTRIHIFDPNFVKIIYENDGQMPMNPPFVDSMKTYRLSHNMSPGLGFSNGEEWYRLRSAIQQMMMKPMAVSQYLPKVDDIVIKFVNKLKTISGGDNDSLVKNMNLEILKWVLDSAAMTCFEKEVNAIDDSELGLNLIMANKQVFNAMSSLKFGLPIYNFAPILSRKFKQLVENEHYIYNTVENLIDETIKNVKITKDEDTFKFIRYLLKSKISLNDLKIITLSLFTDGLSTTAPTMVGILYCLAKNPDKQEQISEEISKFTSINQQLTNEQLNNLSYLKASVKEAFRFFPIGVDVSRILQKPLSVGGYLLPEGSEVCLNTNLLLLEDEYFENANKYMPERWLRDTKKQVHPFLLTPFSHGPRMCAGRRFAEQEMYAFLIRLLQKFRIQWIDDKELEQTYQILLKPSFEASFKLISKT